MRICYENIAKKSSVMLIDTNTELSGKILMLMDNNVELSKKGLINDRPR